MKNINKSVEQNLKMRLEEHEFEFDPQAWKSMNKMLNNHNPRRSPLWISSLVMMTAIVTLLSVAWYVPFEPIQEFFEEVFDTNEEVIKEKPIQQPVRVMDNDLESFEVIPGEVEQNNTPTKVERKSKTPVAPIRPMGPPDLLELQQQQMIDKEHESAKPIAALSSYVEDESGEITPIDLPVQRKVRAGFFGGGTVAVSGSPLIPQGAISPSIGVFAGYNINEKWGVQMEVNFRKGFVQPFTSKEDRSSYLNLPPNDPSAENTFDRVVANQNIIAKNLTVVEFPILAKYKINEKSSVMAGVRPSWIHVKDPNSDNNSADVRHSPIYEKLDVGISVGYEMQLSKRVAVNIRYNQGVTDMFRDSEESYLNNDLQASIRYTLNP